ncbi:MAG: IclR family transcriptional regulator [Actinomycetia bacterium]|nr:IclR family transcriptional regulator [Actinomycetes bacterium]MCP4959407.1 IclR family transcriptional regulator [Actinomycetes bacterium]
MVSGVGVLDKSFTLLRAVESSPKTLGELVEETGFSRATTHRLLSALVDHQILRRSGESRFELGWSLIPLGRTASERLPLSRAARPVLEILRDRSGESTQLYVEEGGQRVCVLALDSPDELRTVVAVGSRLPMDKGSAGAALSGRVEPKGWVQSVGERAPGVAAVSAPVLLPDGSVVAAVSVSGPIERLGEVPGLRYGESVLAAAVDLSERLAD